LNIYKEFYNDDMINRNIDGAYKKKCVKNILGMERKLLEVKIGIIDKEIEKVVRNKEERDIYQIHYMNWDDNGVIDFNELN